MILKSFGSKLQIAQIGCIVMLAAFFSGCKEKELPDLKGRYQGSQLSGQADTQVVAQLPDFIEVNKKKILRFRVYPTLGSARGIGYQITAASDKLVLLSAPSLSSSELQLAKSGNCATGKNGSEDVRLCWATGKLDLEMGSGRLLSFALHIKRDDSLPPFDERTGPGRAYTLDELLGRAKFQNYAVAQEAERVFQAKENIKAARGNLLPKLSLRAVVGIFTGDYLSVVGNALPFLFPSNWFKWKASKEIFQAERKSFASLRGNQMNSVEGLYYLIYRDQAVAAELDRHVAWMRRTQDNLRQEEQVGTVPTGSADYYGTSITLLERDQTNLNALIRSEYAELSQAVALPPLNGISALSGLDLPELDQVQPIRAEDFYRDAQLKSYEIKALGFLEKAASYLTTDVFFQFLNPEGDGAIGFGTANQFRVGKSQQRELQKRIDEMYSLVEKKSLDATTEFNTALQSYQIAKNGLQAIQRRLDWLMQRHLTGDSSMDETEFLDQLADLQFKVMGLTADKLSAVQSWLLARAKVQRLLLNGFYQKLEDALPQDQEELQRFGNQPGAPAAIM